MLSISQMNPEPLTAREAEVLQCIAEGLSSKQIAVRLFIAKYTVDNHRKNLLRKMRVSNSSELIMKYIGMKK